MSLRMVLSWALLGVLVVLSLGEEPKKIVSFDQAVAKVLKAAFESCLVDNGLGEEAVDVVREGEYKDEEPFQNFIYCAFKRFGGFGENGRVNLTIAAAPFPKELNILTILQNCVKDYSEDPVKDFFEFFKCFQKTSPVRMQMY